MDGETREEIEHLNQTVDAFADEMKARLATKAMKWYRGWTNPENYQAILKMMPAHSQLS